MFSLIHTYKSKQNISLAKTVKNCNAEINVIQMKCDYEIEVPYLNS